MANKYLVVDTFVPGARGEFGTFKLHPSTLNVNRGDHVFITVAIDGSWNFTSEVTCTLSVPGTGNDPFTVAPPIITSFNQGSLFVLGTIKGDAVITSDTYTMTIYSANRKYQCDPKIKVIGGT